MRLHTKVCFVVLGSLFAFILDINESVSKLYASFYGTCFSLLLFHEQFEQICHIISTVFLWYSLKHIAFRYCDTIRDIMSCHETVLCFLHSQLFYGKFYHFGQI